MDKVVIDFRFTRFEKLCEERIEDVQPHVLQHSLRNAYLYIDFLHAKFGEPLTTGQRGKKISDGMKKAKENGKHVGRPRKGPDKINESA